jgi:hypothetical protein
MSGAASESKGGAKKKAAAPEKETDKAAEAKAAAPAAAEEAPGPMVESQGDRFETLMEYDPKSKVPFAVVLVWACALIGLGTYTVTLYFPYLALWGSP